MPTLQVNENFTADGFGSPTGPVLAYGARQTLNTLHDYLHGKEIWYSYLSISSTVPEITFSLETWSEVPALPSVHLVAGLLVATSGA